LEIREQCISDAENGLSLTKDSYDQIIKKYKRIIVWGAGNLGRVICHLLSEKGIEVSAVWDTRFQDVPSFEGLPVREPLAEKLEKDDLVVFCITNNFVVQKLMQKLDECGIEYIRGIYLYQAYICPVSNENPCLSECYKRVECNVPVCQRASSALREIVRNNPKIYFDTVDVYLTQNCSLNCKYCYIYENSYPASMKHNFDKADIIADVDAICDAASFIKRMVPFGGEPFLHPEIGEIVSHMHTKKNVAGINIISNGIFNRSDAELKELKLDNLRIDISNYNSTIRTELLEIREDNIRRMQLLGLPVFLNTDTPSWRKPGNFQKNGMTVDALKAKKSCCGNYYSIDERLVAETVVVKGRKVFPCQYCDTMFQLGLTEGTQDYIDLEMIRDGNQLSCEITKLLEKDYYMACDRCNSGIELVEDAGEQGLDEIYEVERYR